MTIRLLLAAILPMPAPALPVRAAPTTEVRKKRQRGNARMNMKAAFLGVLLALLADAPPTEASTAPTDLVLEKIVLLARHGVRSPTKSGAELAKFAAEAWPVWPVAPGELTAHGAQTVIRMGTYLRRRYAAEGLFPIRGCPPDTALFVWADNADQRTRASGDALVAGLAPGCPLISHHAPAGPNDPLFGSVPHGSCTIDPDQAKAAVLARAGGSLDALGPTYERARATLQHVLFPDVVPSDCVATGEAKCFLLASRNSLRVTGDSLRLEGPLAASATISESILLEYAEGFAPDKIGWGRAATTEALAAIIPLHDLYADLMRRTPYLASRHGALLAKQIADAIANRGQPGDVREAPVPTSARFVAFVGHDTNLSNIAGLLDIDWTLPGQPDKTAPDTALAFEIWRKPHSEERYVRLVVHYQTLTQLRATAGRKPADRAAESITVSIPGCTDGPDGLCRLNAVADRLTKAIEPGCLP